MDKKTYTPEEWRAEGKRRFGEHFEDWKFKCPSCGNIASGKEFKDAGAEPNDMYQTCIGRPTNGLIYDCNNASCFIKQEAMKAEREADQKVLKIQEENRQNGVDIQEMIRSRRQAELTIRDCAQALGVSLSKYSDYEHERAPMPLQEWQKIMAIIREEVSHGNHSRTITSQEPYSCLGTGAWPGSHRR
jgi:DNA-binding transcriptional regulator YiaG